MNGTNVTTGGSPVARRSNHAIAGRIEPETLHGDGYVVLRWICGQDVDEVHITGPGVDIVMGCRLTNQLPIRVKETSEFCLTAIARGKEVSNQTLDVEVLLPELDEGAAPEADPAPGTSEPTPPVVNLKVDWHGSKPEAKRNFLYWKAKGKPVTTRVLREWCMEIGAPARKETSDPISVYFTTGLKNPGYIFPSLRGKPVSWNRKMFPPLAVLQAQFDGK